MTIVKELDALHVNGEEYKFPANEGDMKYSDFSLVTKSGATVTLDLFSEIEPSANFTVNAPSEIKEGQMYILRVTTGATPYTMTLGTGITNPYNESTTLTANTVHQFGFLAIDGDLELQPSATGGVWGSITGTLSNQTDLQTALNAKANASDINTKTFDVEELTVSELQPVMDFYANGGYPIIYYSDSGTEYPRRRGYYTLAYPPSSSTALFRGEMGNANTYATPGSGQSTTTSCISISLSDGTVTSASFQNSNFINYLSTSQTNDQYTPTNNYDPATKKYVDDIKPTSGSTTPSTTPTYVGQQYVDTTNNKLYVATGTTSSSDWTEVGSGGGGGFEVVNTLPSIAQADENKLYILGPIGSGSDKYEEWIVTETSTPGHFESQSTIDHEDFVWTDVGSSHIWNYNGPISNKYIGINNFNIRRGQIKLSDGNNSDADVLIDSSTTMPYVWKVRNEQTQEDEPYMGVSPYIDRYDAYTGSGSADLYYSDSELTRVPASTTKQWTKIGEAGGGGNVIAMTQSEYNALSTAEKNDGKLRIITDAPTEAISVDWDNVANKKVDLSTQTGNLSELKFWIGTTTAYQNLGSYDNNTVYICKKVIS